MNKTRYTGFALVCACLAARSCFNAGQSVERIAKSAKRHSSTVRRWLAVCP
jgi:hypothetical protein